MLDHRHPRFLRDALDQALAAARHDDVNVFRHGDEVADGRAVGGFDHLHRRFRQAGGREAGAHAGGDGLIAADRFLAAAQDRGVAGLEAQRRGVGRDVGARLVDDADHAERHAHLADLDAGGAELHVGNLADRVGQRGDLFEALRHRFDALGGERQAIEHGRLQTVGARLGDIFGIGGEQFIAAGADIRGHGQQRGVLGGGRLALAICARSGARLPGRGFACRLQCP